MAVDTAARRFSMLDMCGSATGIVMPLPSGTIGAGSRIDFLGLYSGLFDAGGGPPAGGDNGGMLRLGVSNV